MIDLCPAALAGLETGWRRRGAFQKGDIVTQEIHVKVVEFGDRRHYQLQWTDPITGRKKTKSSGVEVTGRKRERDAAEKEAGKLEDRLRTGRYRHCGKIAWPDFRQRYEDEVLASFAPATEKKACGVFNLIEQVLSPRWLSDLTAARLSYLQKHMRDNQRSEQTIKGHFAHLLAALNWAVRMGMISKAPNIEKPQRAKRQEVMKGRPITGEEFERMLDKVAEVLTEPPNKRRRLPKPPPPEASDSWKHFLTGLWLSGLRLSEALQLSWDEDDRLRVDLGGRRPMMRIPAALEKGNRDRLLPITPDFAEFLLQTPEEARTGFVFNPAPRRGERTKRLGDLAVGRIVGAIGAAAGVKVHTHPTRKDENGRPLVKFASAHDLRRSFGDRWARKVMPMVLQELMRHESIETTMRFYVVQDAEQTADIVWSVFESGNTFGNSGPSVGEAAKFGANKNPCHRKG